jgi:hypothetical protein
MSLPTPVFEENFSEQSLTRRGEFLNIEECGGHGPHGGPSPESTNEFT